MNRDNSKNTLIALVALIVICGGSFFGVKMFNRDVKAAPAPVIITTTENKMVVTDNVTTTGAVITPATTLPAATTTTALAETTKLNQFTTFANPAGTTESTSASDTTAAADTTVPTTAPTTTNNITVSPMTTAPSTTQAQQAADSLIQDAAIFSEGFLSFVFNPDDNYYYTVSDPWQRSLGFNELYDMGAPFVVMYYDTMRCKFNYDNRDWLIQFWKGQYGFVFVGCEIGVYNKPVSRTTEHYDCASDEDSLYMSMSFYRKGKEVLTREYSKYWWCTGFVPGKLDSFSDRSELSMRCRITCKDSDMLLAFCDSLKGNGLVFNQDFTTQGNDVFIHWQ